MVTLQNLLSGGLQFICAVPCPLCGSCDDDAPLGRGLCQPCQRRLELPLAGLEGRSPLPWWSLGWYQGSLRRLLLSQRLRPQNHQLGGLARQLRQALAGSPSWQRSTGVIGPLLVAIPSWKRRANPLPALLCRSLPWPRPPLLQRSRATVGQHHLNRQQRLENQAGAFLCRFSRHNAPSWQRHRPVVLVDDILTTGATARDAARALRAGGWRVAGLICLGRTPWAGNQGEGDSQKVVF